MTTRKKNTSAAVAALVQTATAKAAAVVAKAETMSEDMIRTATLEALHSAASIEEAAKVQAEGIRREAINAAIDAGRKAGLDTGEIKDMLSDILDLAVEAKDLTEGTAKSYRNGIAFAVDRSVPWTSDLHGTAARVKALEAAKKAIPKSLQQAAKKLAEKEAAKAAREATREAKQSNGHMATMDTIVKALAKALADARTLGRNTLAMDILDVIHSVQPDFAEPRPE